MGFLYWEIYQLDYAVQRDSPRRSQNNGWLNCIRLAKLLRSLGLHCPGPNSIEYSPVPKQWKRAKKNKYFILVHK